MAFPSQSLRIILWTVFGAFFLFFGIQVLVAAYSLKDPFSFVLTFFASNLIILISGVVLLGVFFNIKGRFGKREHEPQGDQGGDKEGEHTTKG